MEGIEETLVSEVASTAWTETDVANIINLFQFSFVAYFILIAIVLVLVFAVSFKNRNL